MVSAGMQPAAPAAPPDAGVARPNCALVVPSSYRRFVVDGATVEIVAGPPVGSFMDRHSLDAIRGDEDLADGKLVRYARGSDTISVMFRNLDGGMPILCDDYGASSGERAAALALCAGLRAAKKGLLVPIVVPTGGGGSSAIFSSDLVSVALAAARADSPADVAAVATATSGMTVIKEQAINGGFAVAFKAWKGGTEADDLEYKAIARARLGTIDILCESGRVTSEKAAVDAMALCASLRAP